MAENLKAVVLLDENSTTDKKTDEPYRRSQMASFTLTTGLKSLMAEDPKAVVLLAERSLTDQKTNEAYQLFRSMVEVANCDELVQAVALLIWKKYYSTEDMDKENLGRCFRMASQLKQESDEVGLLILNGGVGEAQSPTTVNKKLNAHAAIKKMLVIPTSVVNPEGTPTSDVSSKGIPTPVAVEDCSSSVPISDISAFGDVEVTQLNDIDWFKVELLEEFMEEKESEHLPISDISAKGVPALCDVEVTQLNDIDWYKVELLQELMEEKELEHLPISDISAKGVPALDAVEVTQLNDIDWFKVERVQEENESEHLPISDISAITPRAVELPQLKECVDDWEIV